MTRLLAAIVLLMLAAGCSKAPAPAAPEERGSVVIYAAQADETYLPSLFANFTRETGILVTVRHGEAEQIIDDVIADRGSPPADVVISADVVGVWRAADEGALRPLDSQITERVSAHLSDPDGYWVAAAVHTVAIAYDSRTVEESSLDSYETLADEDFRNELCLSSSTLPGNRAVVAMLIDKLGTRPAELIVRGWVANLAQPVFDSQAELVAAIDRGSCGVGIVSLPAQANSDATRLFIPNPAYFDIEGVAVARHARSPDAAARLIDWFLASTPATRQTAGSGIDNVSVVAWRAEDAEKLAERARYR